MLTPRGFEMSGRSHRPARLRRRRRRVRLLLGVVLAAAVVAGGYYAWGRWLADPQPGTVALSPAATVPSPTASHSPSQQPACRPPAPRAVHVRVLNSTTKAGLAAAVGRGYRSRGFTVASVGNTSGPIGGTVLVRSGTRGAAGARSVAAYVAGSRLVTDRRTDASVDVVLGSAYSRLRTSPVGGC